MQWISLKFHYHLIDVWIREEEKVLLCFGLLLAIHLQM